MFVGRRRPDVRCMSGRGAAAPGMSAQGFVDGKGDSSCGNEPGRPLRRKDQAEKPAHATQPISEELRRRRAAAACLFIVRGDAAEVIGGCAAHPSESCDIARLSGKRPLEGSQAGGAYPREREAAILPSEKAPREKLLSPLFVRTGLKPQPPPFQGAERRGVFPPLHLTTTFVLLTGRIVPLTPYDSNLAS